MELVPKKRTPTARQQMALALSCLFLLGQASVQLHHALVRHEICAEHGELVHAGHSESGRSADAPDLLAYRGSPPPSDEGHEHCDVESDRRDLDVVFASALSVDAPQHDGIERALRVCLRSSERERYRVAPKGSPPA